MIKKTKFMKKQTGANLVPELYDGYDYQYSIVQKFRNSKGLLDSNPIFNASVVKVIKIVNAKEGEHNFVVIAKVFDIDETFEDVPVQTDYESSEDIVLMDKFIPENLSIQEPEVGELIYIQYADPHNRIGGIYKGRMKGFTISNLVNDSQNSIKNSKNNFNNNVSSLSSVGECRYSNRQTAQVDYSNCKTVYQEGEFEIFFGDKTSLGKVRMVYADFNSKPNILVQQIAYNSLKQMFEDASREGVTLTINSGFRSYETQECFFNNFLACYEEWRNGGRVGEKPSVAANPKLSTPSVSSHLNGLAADFNTGVSRTQPEVREIFNIASTNPAAALEDAKNKLNNNTITSQAWKWLVFNSERYGWVWSGIKFREPWHFHFDEKLARNNGFV